MEAVLCESHSTLLSRPLYLQMILKRAIEDF